MHMQQSNISKLLQNNVQYINIRNFVEVMKQRVIIFFTFILFIPCYNNYC